MVRIGPPPKKKTLEPPPEKSETLGNLDKPSLDGKENLNFKVPTQFKREIKAYAATQGMSLTELLAEGYRLVREKRGN